MSSSRGPPGLISDPWRKWAQTSRAARRMRRLTPKRDIVVRQGNGTLPKTSRIEGRGPIMTSRVGAVHATAEKLTRRAGQRDHRLRMDTVPAATPAPQRHLPRRKTKPTGVPSRPGTSWPPRSSRLDGGVTSEDGRQLIAIRTTQPSNAACSSAGFRRQAVTKEYAEKRHATRCCRRSSRRRATARAPGWSPTTSSAATGGRGWEYGNLSSRQPADARDDPTPTAQGLLRAWSRRRARRDPSKFGFVARGRPQLADGIERKLLRQDALPEPSGSGGARGTKSSWDAKLGPESAATVQYSPR